MKKWLLIIIILFTVIAVTIPANCRANGVQGAPAILSIMGSVSSISWVTDKLAIRIFDNGRGDEIVFDVTKETVITRGLSTISFGDILISDNVTVSYYNTLSGLKAVRITVKR